MALKLVLQWTLTNRHKHANTEQMSSFREIFHKLYTKFPQINSFIYLLNLYFVSCVKHNFKHFMNIGISQRYCWFNSRPPQ